MRHPNRFLTAAGACIALLVILAGVAVAQGAHDKFRSGDTVTIAAGETVSSDLYAFAGTVRVEGTVDGDLVASGGLVDVIGTVTGDVLAAGGSVNISGTVGGDARIAGGTLSVGGAIAEDLLAAGGQLTVTSSGTVGEDLIAGTGRLTIDGAVTRDVLATTGAYTKAGTVGGTEDVTINTPETVQPGEPGAAPTTTQLVIDAVRHFLVVVLVGALMIWLAPRAYAAMKTSLQQRPLPAAGWGVVAILGFIVLVIAVLILMILLALVFGLLGFSDLVGINLLGGIVAILGASLAFAVITGYVADALVGVALASLVMRGENASRWRELAVLAVGAAVVVLLSSLPVVGPLVKLVVILLGLGAVVLAWRRPRGTDAVVATSGFVQQPQPPPAPQTPAA